MQSLSPETLTDILTVTTNPALDVSTSTEKVIDTHKLRCTPAQMHPGGGGINVARVVHRLGGKCLALYPAGGVTGQLLQQMLDRAQVPNHCVAIQGETRESFSVYEATTRLDYRFVLPGPEMRPEELQTLLGGISALHTPPRYLVGSGSLAAGVPVDFYGQLAKAARARGSLFVVDTSGPGLAAALAEGVFMFKPSLRELRELTGMPLSSEAEWREAALRIIRAGQAQMVALTLGEDGALVVTAEMALRAPSIPVKAASAIGAGDSFVAGMIWALNRQLDLEHAFRYAMAAGAAAVLSEGTELCEAADVERLAGEVRVTRS